MSVRKRIAVLFHRQDSKIPASLYIVDRLAQCWREDGHDVLYLYGTKVHVEADLLLVHVNLSVVPEEYLNFASHYPVALNAQLRNIKKSVISGNIVSPGDSWAGPVIVKSDLNYGGSPEQYLTQSRIEQAARRAVARLTGRQLFDDWKRYRVFDSPKEVPRSLFKRQDVVVERFLPEYEDGLFHLRVYQVLGDRCTCTRLASHSPVFKASMSVSSEPVDPHPAVEEWRKQLKLDYGKLDYLIHKGDPVLIDVNKTTGASTVMGNAPLPAMRRQLAEGLYSYFG